MSKLIPFCDCQQMKTTVDEPTNERTTDFRLQKGITHSDTTWNRLPLLIKSFEVFRIMQLCACCIMHIPRVVFDVASDMTTYRRRSISIIFSTWTWHLSCWCARNERNNHYHPRHRLPRQEWDSIEDYTSLVLSSLLVYIYVCISEGVADTITYSALEQRKRGELWVSFGINEEIF